MTDARAWKVEWGSDDGCLDVVFARTRSEARRGADTCGDDPELTDITAKRAPEFDRCKTVAELRQAQLDEGWRFTCFECEHYVDGDGCDTCFDEGEGLGVTRDCAPPPVIDGAAVFCAVSCQLAYYANRGRYAGNRLGVCLDAVEKWPGITIVSSNGSEYPPDERMPGAQIHYSKHERPVGGVDFTFPGGGEYRVHWVRGHGTIRVHGDMADAWERFAAQCKEAANAG